jgi:hypothetical protein
LAGGDYAIVATVNGTQSPAGVLLTVASADKNTAAIDSCSRYPPASGALPPPRCPYR